MINIRLIKLLLYPFFINLLGIIFLFMAIMVIVDLFQNFASFQEREVAIMSIFYIQLLNIPKVISQILPIALIFSATYSLGTLRSNNELIVIFGNGISFYQFVIPFIILGLFFSIGSYFFEEFVVIDTYREKQDLQSTLLGYIPESSTNNQNVTRYSNSFQTIYSVGYYNAAEKSLENVIIIERDKNFVFTRRIDADYAIWNEEKQRWFFSYVSIYSKVENDMLNLQSEFYLNFNDSKLNASPDIFEKSNTDIIQLRRKDARQAIMIMQKSGISVDAELTQYYKRFSFSLTPFLVMLMACSVGSRAKKNIFIISISFAILITISYYVITLVVDVVASKGYISALVGAWGGISIYFIISLFLFFQTKT